MSRIPRLRAGLIGIVAFMVSPASQAAQPGYNFLEASYLSATPDDEILMAKRSGYQVLLYSPLEPGHFLQVRYVRSKDERDDKTTGELGGGLGYYSQWSDNLSAYLVLGYEEHTFAGADDKAYSGEIGLRSALSDRLEFTAGGRYLKLDDAEDDTVWFGGLMWQLIPGFGLAARYEQTDTESRYTVGLRLLPQ